jgi:ATP-binding cassette subfamily C (CFTR/MRP) protein 4
VNTLQVGSAFYYYALIGPVQLLIVVVILWFYMGPACLAGLLLLVLYIPFQGKLSYGSGSNPASLYSSLMPFPPSTGTMGRFFGILKKKVASKTDQRIRFMNELISAIRVIKMYVWESAFGGVVADFRK